MERPVKPFGLTVEIKAGFPLEGGTSLFILDRRADDSRGAGATIDHSDIRGSEPHGHDPSGAASD
jgi:hypothetical protein